MGLFAGNDHGLLGTVVTTTNESGASVQAILPQVQTVSSTGAAMPAANSADPAYFVQEPVTAAPAAVLSSQSTVAEGSRVAKASAGNLYGFECCSGASAGYLMVFDSATVPAEGAVAPKLVYAVAANTSFARQVTYPFRCTTGITLVFSTTGPFTKTISATAFLAAHYV